MRTLKFFLLALLVHLLVLFGLPHLPGEAIAPPEVHHYAEVTLTESPPESDPPDEIITGPIMPRDDSPPPGPVIQEPAIPDKPLTANPGDAVLPINEAEGTVPVGEAGSLGGGWEGHGHGAQYIGKWNERTYQVIAAPEGITWAQASDAAHARGGILAIVDCQDVNDLVFKLTDDPTLWHDSPDGKASIGPWINGQDATEGWPAFTTNNVKEVVQLADAQGLPFPDRKGPWTGSWSALITDRLFSNPAWYADFLAEYAAGGFDKKTVFDILSLPYFNWATGEPNSSYRINGKATGLAYFARGAGNRQPTWGVLPLRGGLAYAYVVEYLPWGTLTLFPAGDPRGEYAGILADKKIWTALPYVGRRYPTPDSWITPFRPDPAKLRPQVIEQRPLVKTAPDAIRYWFDNRYAWLPKEAFLADKEMPPLQRIGNKAYQVFLAPNGISWYDAAVEAMVRGGHLASIHSAEENAVVFALVNRPEFWRNTPDGRAALGPWLAGYSAGPSVAGGNGILYLHDELTPGSKFMLNSRHLISPSYAWVFFRNENESRSAMGYWYASFDPFLVKTAKGPKVMTPYYANWAKAPPGGPQPNVPVIISELTSPHIYTEAEAGAHLPPHSKSQGVLFYSTVPDQRQPTWGSQDWDMPAYAFVVEWDYVPVRAVMGGGGRSFDDAPKPPTTTDK